MRKEKREEKEVSMTEKEIKSAIRKCPYKEDLISEKRRDYRYVLCRLHCLPCLRAIEKGLCEELRRVENE